MKIDSLWKCDGASGNEAAVTFRASILEARKIEINYIEKVNPVQLKLILENFNTQSFHKP